MSDRDFALLAEVSYTQVQRMEGRIPDKHYKRDKEGASPTIERFRKYLAACEYSPTQFFAELEKRPIPDVPDDPTRLDLHAQLTDLLDLGEEVQRLVVQRFAELEAWLESSRRPGEKKGKKRDVHKPSESRSVEGRPPGEVERFCLEKQNGRSSGGAPAFLSERRASCQTCAAPTLLVSPSP